MEDNTTNSDFDAQKAARKTEKEDTSKPQQHILGLDIGTNSIGWALLSTDSKGQPERIVDMGSRIIPMGEDVLGKFDSGITESSTAERGQKRMMRRMIARRLLRRERLLRVLHELGFLPAHYDAAFGWNKQNYKTYCKFIDDQEQKLAWVEDTNKQARFLFADAFAEMLADFRNAQASWLADHKVPADWTLYYLRQKALRQAISREELAWVLLSFNQKRGYNQARGEEEEVVATKREEFVETTVLEVEDTGEKRNAATWYNLHLEGGLIYRRASDTPLYNMKGQRVQVIVTRDFEADGITPKLDKAGKEKYSVSLPQPDEWKLRKKRTEHQLEQRGLTVGAFIYQHLLKQPDDKIRGNFVHTIDRIHYKEELRQILQEQKKYHPELCDKALFERCVAALYPSNVKHREHQLGPTKDLASFIIDDVLFFQRPLRSKKGTIANCPFEHRTAVDKETGEMKTFPIKVAARSNPYFQEFRIWQFIANLSLANRETEEDVTADYLPDEESRHALYQWLSQQSKVTAEQFYSKFLKLKVKRGQPYPVRWNYPEDKAEGYPMGETRAELLKALHKAEILPSLNEAPAIVEQLLPPTLEYLLWHLLYSVSDRKELQKALEKLSRGEGLFGKLPEAATLLESLCDDDKRTAFVDAMLRIKPFDNGYAALSEKALKKLLAVMRCGKAWQREAITSWVEKRIGQMQNGEMDEKLLASISKTGHALHSLDDCRGLSPWRACYLVYGRHSEASEIVRWTSPEAIDAYLKGFHHHSLRNPIVEQVILETLRTVRDIWQQYVHIDEIHVELGREMKNPADKRKRISQQNQENEATRARIRSLLVELKNEGVADVRPMSPIQQDILRIYEEGALATLSEKNKEDAEILKISKKAQPTAAEMLRYRLWLDQKYRSPYTGRFIPLARLFTPNYEIEHIIPRSRFLDDSMSNKVICETEVNRLKGNLLAHEFIAQHHGQKVLTANGEVAILETSQYEALVKETFADARLRRKRENLLRDDLPTEFAERQLNDTRYITRVVKGLLSNVVREEDEREATSKHLIVTNGSITDRLKRDWGLNDVWNELLLPRFQRLNRLQGGTNEKGLYGQITRTQDGKKVFMTQLPEELQNGFSKKRLDHRHHAMDALVVACASRGLVQFLNNVNAGDPETHEQERTRFLLTRKYTDAQGEEQRQRLIRKPWDSFTQDSKAALQQVVVSFKHRQRLLTRTTNRYAHFDAEGKRTQSTQQGERMWAVRKPLHKDTIYGRVNLRRKKEVKLLDALKQADRIVDRELRKYVQGLLASNHTPKKIGEHFKAEAFHFQGRKVERVEVWYFTDEVERLSAVRCAVDENMTRKKIESITDTGIQKILLNYLAAKDNNPKVAFSPEGLAELNANIAQYNGGRAHQPIKKVRVTETLGSKYAIGTKGNRSTKYVEAQKGTNLFFALYIDSEGKRDYETIPLNVAIERTKQGLPPVPEQNEKGAQLLFSLSPNDLVYVPTEEECAHLTITPQELQKERIFKFISSTGRQALFLPYAVAKTIHNKVEFESLNKMERAVFFDGESSTPAPMVKAVCWKLEQDRLGHITRIIR